MSMRRLGCMTIAALLVFSCCQGCGTGSGSVSKERLETDRMQVVTSFYPMYDFAQKIGGERVDVTNMVPAGTEPHDWEPAPVDLAALEEADVFIYNGAGMEHWVEDVLESIGNDDLVIVEASTGVELLEEDAHVWLDPENAKIEMENVRQAFSEADPEHEGDYESHYEEYAKKLDQLDQTFREGLEDVKHRDIIVAHEAFGYLCKAYDLNQVGIEGLSPDSEPDPARMDEVIQFARENQVKTIFFEELVSPKVAETIAEEIGAKTQVLNPLEGLSDEDIEAGADYFSVMEENLSVLQKALNE